MTTGDRRMQFSEEFMTGLFDKYMYEVDVGAPNVWANFVGVEIKCSWFDNKESLAGTQILKHPLPNDAGLVTGAEHASLLAAINRAEKNNQKSFAAVELGAAWGPWISEAGVICNRRGFKKVNLVGVEAHKSHFEKMQEHLKRNGVEARLLNGAAWHEETTLKFPETSEKDYGAFAATADGDYMDGKRQNLKMVEVKAYTLPQIVEGMHFIDFMHWDIQGAEAALASANEEILNKQVRSLMIATHSRAIEGRLIEFFYDNKWDIAHEEPCRFNYNRRRLSLEKMTVADGIIYARNPKTW